MLYLFTGWQNNRNYTRFVANQFKQPCGTTYEIKSDSNHTQNKLIKTQKFNLNFYPVSQLRNFWQQLMADNTFFSACGMCRIDRPLLTTVR